MVDMDIHLPYGYLSMDTSLTVHMRGEGGGNPINLTPRCCPIRLPGHTLPYYRTVPHCSLQFALVSEYQRRGGGEKVTWYSTSEVAVPVRVR